MNNMNNTTPQQTCVEAVARFLVAQMVERVAQDNRKAAQQQATEAIADMTKSMAESTATVEVVAAAVAQMKMLMASVTAPDAVQTPANIMIEAMAEVRALQTAATDAAAAAAVAAAESEREQPPLFDIRKAIAKAEQDSAERAREAEAEAEAASADDDDGAVILSSRCPLESLFGATLRAQQKVDQSAAALTKAEEEGGSSEVLEGAREALRAAEAECAAAIAKYDEARREAGETHMDRVEV